MVDFRNSGNLHSIKFGFMGELEKELSYIGFPLRGGSATGFPESELVELLGVRARLRPTV